MNIYIGILFTITFTHLLLILAHLICMPRVVVVGGVLAKMYVLYVSLLFQVGFWFTYFGFFEGVI